MNHYNKICTNLEIYLKDNTMNNNDLFEALKQLEKLKTLLIQGEKLGIDTSLLTSKLDSIVKSMGDSIIRIVLLGSFSDGKTSVIAGFLGQLKENMKIDQDESSDEISIYHFDGVDNVEIIDTPGLFGTKEKEVEGKNVKYSEITQRYISEANIVIYVCDAVTPLKESHVEIIKKVLRDYGKLKSTIFVLNKMDEAGYDMLDKADYERGVKIKREALIERLKDAIDLSDEEILSLQIACIAADPKGKGLDYWLSNAEVYKKRSHIEQLKDCISNILATSNIDTLKVETNLAVITDVVSNAQDQLETLTIPVEQAVQEAQVLTAELVQDSSTLRHDLIVAKGRLLNDLYNLLSSIITDINESDRTSIGNLIETKIGKTDDKIDFNIIYSKINQRVSECVESNNYAITSKERIFSKKMSLQETYIKDALKLGAKNLGKISISNTQVLTVRNLFAKGYKFKPWGAVKMAKNVTKAAKVGGNVITLGLNVYEYFKEKKEEKKFNDFKENLKSDISATFKEFFKLMESDQHYFEEFAPSYLEMCKAVETRNAELLKLQSQIQLLRQYNQQLNLWLTNKTIFLNK